jgi:hypothetical protein
VKKVPLTSDKSFMIPVLFLFGFWVAVAACATAWASQDLFQPPPDESEARHGQTVIDLQPLRKTTSIPIHNGAGKKGRAVLINLNPQINAWFVLAVQWPSSGGAEVYHLENPLPGSNTIGLDPKFPMGLIVDSDKGKDKCLLWDEPQGGAIARAASSGAPYSPLCEGRLWLRNATEGHKTNLEAVTDLLRQHIWQGEKITTFVRETFFQDAFLDTAPEIVPPKPMARKSARPGAPSTPLVNKAHSGHFLKPTELGIALENETGPHLMIGRWYAVKGLSDVYVSVLQPNMVDAAIIESTRRQVNAFDQVEATALVYVVAFDLDRFELGFEMGTEHPKVGWSERVPETVRDQRLSGPDGIDTLSPLVMTGMLNPTQRPMVAATFAGGFKRYHGAFRWSALAQKNHGSHYGFLQYGTILSRLQPELATVLTFDDGSIDMVTWHAGDDAHLARIRHARQNGLPLIDHDPATGASKVGAMVPRWGQGNWSGSVDERLRTVRAGLALQEGRDKRFLLFGYFSAATPSAMARVFAAFQCKYAMMLDINALEHTYMAIYPDQTGLASVEHLVKGMSVLDKTKQGRVMRRFIDFPDNRDFFYLLRRDLP